MDLTTFVQRFRASLPPESILPNPGGGTSTIIWCDHERVCYRRGSSRLYINLSDLHAVYIQFAGKDITTRLLKDYAPSLFDSAHNGHNCHCTFFFLALERMNLATGVWGRGQKGSPFGVTITTTGP